MALCGDCFGCRRLACSARGSVNNPHNTALMAGRRCPNCGLARDGSSSERPACPDSRKILVARNEELVDRLARGEATPGQVDAALHRIREIATSPPARDDSESGALFGIADTLIVMDAQFEALVQGRQ